MDAPNAEASFSKYFVRNTLKTFIEEKKLPSPASMQKWDYPQGNGESIMVESTFRTGKIQLALPVDEEEAMPP